MSLKRWLFLAVPPVLSLLLQAAAQAAPFVAIYAPSPAAGTVTVTAKARHRNLVRLEIYRDGNLLASCPASPCAYPWNTKKTSNGYHTLFARRHGVNGVTESAPLQVVVTNSSTNPDTTPPSVSLSAPSTVSGVATISASASDASGVSGTSLHLDGVLVHNAAGGSLTYSWDSTQVANGTHTLRARATDSGGNVGQSAPASVLVSNGAPPGGGTELPIPELALWESQMVTYGQTHCGSFGNPAYTADQQLGATYYDAIRVFHQIADYTGQASWRTCALGARAVYRDQYVLTATGYPGDPGGNLGGHVPGYWNFTTGLRMDFERTGDATSKEAAILLSNYAAWAGYATDPDSMATSQLYDYSREVAYAILSFINSEALGEPRRARRAMLVTQAYDHLEQFLAGVGNGKQLSPFLLALTAQSLIRDWEQTGDARCIPALRRAADWLWATAWRPAGEAMVYDINGVDGPADPAPDLNLLIAPMYAFLYKQTGLAQYRDQADALFAGGVRYAWLDGVKQFNQSYAWSFDYMTWRTGQ